MKWLLVLIPVLLVSCYVPPQYKPGPVPKLAPVDILPQEGELYDVSHGLDPFDILSDFENPPYDLPTVITHVQVKKHIRKYFRHFYRCGPKIGETVILRVYIHGPTGTVAKAESIEGTNFILEECLVDMMFHMRFSKFETEYIAVDCKFEF